MRRYLSTLCVLALLTSFGCADDDHTRARFDFSALVQHAAQSAVTISSMTLTVSGQGFDPIGASVPVSNPTFELIVPSGSARRFEVMAAGGSGRSAPVYWGYSVTDLPSRATIDVVIPAVPAGGVAGRAIRFDDGRLPADTILELVTEEPFTGFPATFRAPVADGRFGRTLPVGHYQIRGAVKDADGRQWKTATLPVLIEQGMERADLVMVFFRAGQCPDGSSVRDADGDGFFCDEECNDRDDTIFPGRPEIRADGIDQDCDGRDLCWLDADGDGYGARIDAMSASCVDDGVTFNALDCDDNDPALNFDDVDGDTEPSCLFDCDDFDPAVGTDHYERCDDGIDNDCDGATDSADVDCAAPDRDGDGVVDWWDCDPDDPTAKSTDADGDHAYADCGFDVDCDDSNARIGPYAYEKCGDNIDNDCDGRTDDGCIGATDADGDGYPAGIDCDDASLAKNRDDLDGDHFTTCDGDCDDRNWLIGPLIGREHCFDRWDNDCDGLTDDEDTEDCAASCADDDLDGFLCNDCDDTPGRGYLCFGACEPAFVDADGDGWGVGSEISTCPAPGLAPYGGDCDDTNPALTPADFDLDGFTTCSTPADCNDYDPTLVPVDIDGDGANGCAAPIDCDERRATRFEGNTEICDGIDNDCDGDIDEGFDSDADGVADCRDNCELPNPPSPRPAPTGISWYLYGATNSSPGETYQFFLNDVLLGEDTPLYQGMCASEPVGPYFSTSFPSWISSNPAANRLSFSRPAGGLDSLGWVEAWVYFADNRQDFNVCLYGPCGSFQELCPGGPCVGCPTSAEALEPIPPQADADNDLVGDACDCDDTSTSIGAIELCGDQADNDCDGDTDEAACCDFGIHDGDFDGYFPATAPCAPPPELADCNDSTGLARPPFGQTEGETDCYDTFDNDCNGLTDDEEPFCFGRSCTANAIPLAATLLANTPYQEVRYPLPEAAYPAPLCDSGGPRGASACGVDDAGGIWFHVDLLNPSGGPAELEICNEGYDPIYVSTFEASTCNEGTCVSTVNAGSCVKIDPPSSSLDLHFAVDCSAFAYDMFWSMRYFDPNLGGKGVVEDYIVDWDGDGTPDREDTCVDKDGDGYGLAGYRDVVFNMSGCPYSGVDCDDLHATANPAGTEVCDFVDNNCDGQIDEGVAPAPLLSADMSLDPLAVDWVEQSLRGTLGWTIYASTTWSGFLLSSRFLGTSGPEGTANDVEGRLVTAPVSASALSTVGVVFTSFTYNEGGCQGGPDAEWIEVSTDGGSSFIPVESCDAYGLNKPYDGVARVIGRDLSSFAGSTDLRVGFHFDSFDAQCCSEDDGWYIDDVKIYTCDLL